MEKLESENMSLEFQVQSLIKKRENVKTKYQKLFDSIKRTRNQTQGEINELIENVNQKIYAYADVLAQNQDLLITISELKAKLKNVEKGLKATSSVRRSSNRDSTFKNSVLSNTKNSSEKIEVSNSSLSNYMRNKIQTSQMWQKWYELQPNVGWSSVKTPSNVVVQIVLWIVDSGCSKHMTGDRSLLENFVEKFIGTVRFGNDHFAAITGYGDYVQGNITNRRLSHLNFGTINDLTKHDLVDGLLNFKYEKDHLCSACERGKSKKASNPPKVVLSNHSKLELLHMDLCGPMRVASINEKRYNKNPYELLHGIKPNVEYFHVFGSLCYPTNNRDDLGKMKPKADIGIFIGYSQTSKGFRIYNRCTKKIMETIHVKFDELTAMAFEHDSLEPIFQGFINDNSSAKSMNIPSKDDLDNLFRPMYEEYFKKRSFETSINSAAQQVHNHDDSPSTSSIII
ncbi:retrovirus-related pol polyprotein from transposon TNT 1-94 [Tanacetum coccineum]